jgi:hypothetical protein
LHNRRNQRPEAIEIQNPTAFSPSAAFLFEVGVDLVEPMQFMSHFDHLNILIVETLLDLEVVSVGFVEGCVQTVLVGVLLNFLQSSVA